MWVTNVGNVRIAEPNYTAFIAAVYAAIRIA